MLSFIQDFESQVSKLITCLYAHTGKNALISVKLASPAFDTIRDYYVSRAIVLSMTIKDSYFTIIIFGGLVKIEREE